MMSRMILKMKLGVGFGTLLLILAVMGAVGYRALTQLVAIADETDQLMIKKDLVSDLDGSIEMQTTGVRGYLLTGREDLLTHDEEGKRAYTETMDELGKNAGDRARKADAYRNRAGVCDVPSLLRP